MSIPELTADCLKEVISEWTGVPLVQVGRSAMTAERLDDLERHLKSRVIGQEPAISAVVSALKQRFLLGAANRPIGAFIFVGPSGVGKTELARALAEHLFSSEKNLIRFDMSEYQERFNVSRLIGAPPGYVGYDEGGQLTEAMKKQRFAVVLFDEIEKAHPDIFNVLLQVLDDGRLTDASGVTVDFRHTLVILTSNLGNTYANNLTSKLGFHPEEITVSLERETEKQISAAVRDFFRPELLSRIDKVVMFRRLELPDLVQIVRLELLKLQKRASGKKLRFSLTDAALHELARRSSNMDTNAREVGKVVSKEIEQKLVQMISSGDLSLTQPQAISIDVDEESRFHFQVITTSEKE